MQRMSKGFAIIAFSLCFGYTIVAQQAPAGAATTQTSAAAWSPAQSIGLFAFPKNNQNADQQLKDEADCYGAAKQRTGVDAQAQPPATLSEDEKKAAQQQAAANAQQQKGTAVRGAAGGAAGGAAIGAIAGNAGAGAGPERSPELCEAAWHSALPMLSPSSKQPHRRRRSKRKPKRNCSVHIRQASIHFREHS